MIYRYIIPINPKTKKNGEQIALNRKTYRPFVVQSEAYKKYEKEVGGYLIPKPEEPIDYPVTVKCVYYRGSRRVVDKANLDAAIHDILVRYGVLKDDNRDVIASTDGTRVYYDKDNPRVEIEISPLEEEYEQWRK